MQPHPPIYAIPGLGMTPDIFERISLRQGPLRPLAWLEPHDEAETFEHYSLRMSEQISHDEGPVVLIGMSFGGILASRLSRMLPVQQVVLISTIKTHHEKPPWLRLMQQLPLYRFQYRWGRRSTTRLWAPFFGIDSPEDQAFCAPMFNAHSDHYFRWAVRQIVQWENEHIPAPALHLHGNLDRIFPAEYLTDYVSIEGGDHFMVHKEGEQLSARIESWLEEASIPKAKNVF